MKFWMTFEMLRIDTLTNILQFCVWDVIIPNNCLAEDVSGHTVWELSCDLELLASSLNHSSGSVNGGSTFSKTISEFTLNTKHLKNILVMGNIF